MLSEIGHGRCRPFDMHCPMSQPAAGVRDAARYDSGGDAVFAGPARKPRASLGRSPRRPARKIAGRPGLVRQSRITATITTGRSRCRRCRAFSTSMRPLSACKRTRGPTTRPSARRRPISSTSPPHLTDFSETAALISCLDLVITVDTSVAHLAGALGCPTWILLPYTPDYRWLLDRDDSPWYPTVRLFRQTETRDYAQVLDRVRAELVALCAQRKPDAQISRQQTPDLDA